MIGKELVKQNIFTTFAEKYYDRGFNIIPVNGKRPMVADWAEYSQKRITPECLMGWINKFRSVEDVGIGLVLGQFGGTAIDIDHEELLRFMPECAVFKKGEKGLTALFAPCLEQLNLTHYKLDILSAGRQTILPPSRHPSGKFYEWVLCDGDFGLKDLEPFPLGSDEFKELIHQSQMLRKLHIETGELVLRDGRDVTVVGTSGMGGTDRGLGNGTGRNNHLTAVAYAMACSGEVDSVAVMNLIEEDRRAHPNNLYFDDKEEWRSVLNPIENARHFWERAKKAAVKKGLRNEAVSSSGVSGTVSGSGEAKPKVLPITGRASDEVAVDTSKKELEQLIEDSGPVMQLFIKHCRELSKKDLPMLYLGGALAMCATLAGNNVQFNGTWPNLYLFNFAPSGTGKSIPQTVLTDLFTKSGFPRVMGMSQYRSTAGILSAFVGRPKNVRLDLQDEIGDFFDKLGSQENFKSIVHVLSQIWSAGPSSFGETMLADPKKKTEVVYNPSVSWCGYCTPSAVRGKLDQDFMRLGLGNRVLYLFQDAVGDAVESVDALADADAEISAEWGVSGLDGEVLAMNEDLLAVTRYWITRDPRIENLKGAYSADVSGEMKPTNLKISAGGRKRLVEAFKRTFLMRHALVNGAGGSDEDGENSWLVGILNRRNEQIRRLAICHWMSRCGMDCEDAGFELTHSDVQWAERFYDIQYHGLRTFADLTFDGELSGMSMSGVLLEEMRKYVQRKAGETCPEVTWRGQFYRACKKNLHVGKVHNHIQMKAEIERSLIQSGEVTSMFVNGKKEWKFLG